MQGTDLHEASVWRAFLNDADLALADLRKANFTTPIDKEALDYILQAPNAVPGPQIRRDRVKKQAESRLTPNNSAPAPLGFKASKERPAIVDDPVDPLLEQAKPELVD